MSSKAKTIVSTGLIVGFLTISTTPAVASNYWHWVEKGHRWERRADIRSSQRDLTQAKRQLEYDRSHHASRRTIAQDEARVRDIKRDIGADVSQR